jgi:predicted ATPase
MITATLPATRPQAPSTDRFVVITGGPGAGKSALIDYLRRLGCACMAEAGRAIIQDQVIIGGRALPWADTGLFAETILAWEMRSYRAAERDPSPLVFFDRGVPDVAGYLRLLGGPIPAHVEAATRVFRYRHRVFLAPPWPRIYRPGTERKQTFGESRRTFEAMAAAYAHCGYELMTLPRAPVAERAAFVLRNL